MAIIETLAAPVIIFGALMSLAPVLVLGERRISAFIQHRLGPNRVGPMGTLQPLADVVKLLFKEDVIPANADRWLYTLAPGLVFATSAFAFATIPVGRNLQIVDVNIGVLFVITVTSLGVYGIALGGWASNNKYSLLGGLRSNAQMVSYEISLGLALIGVLMISGTVDFQDIVTQQSNFLHWNIWQQPVAFMIFFVAAFAENNRLPFDLPECESELVGGYHTEYSGMKFGIFFLGEYLAMVTMSALLVSLFLGGWNPGFELPEGTLWTLVSVGVFTGKVLVILFIYLWVRWTLPRFRYDQLMKLGWKVLIPLALANIVVTAVVMAIFESLKHGE